MGEPPCRDEIPARAISVSGVVAALPQHMQSLFVGIVGTKDPELLAALQAKGEPTENEERAVEAILADELATQMGPPDWEPTAEGLAIEQLIKHFFVLWPLDRTKE